MRIGILLLLWVVLWGTGCQRENRHAAQMEQRPVLGHLQTVDRKITLYGGGDEVTFSVATLDGEVLGENLTLGQLRTRFPRLVQPVESGMADLDARLYAEEPLSQ